MGVEKSILHSEPNKNASALIYFLWELLAIWKGLFRFWLDGEHCLSAATGWLHSPSSCAAARAQSGSGYPPGERHQG